MRHFSAEPVSGQSLVEYALLVSFVGLVSLGTMFVLALVSDSSVASAGKGIMGNGVQGISGSSGAGGSSSTTSTGSSGSSTTSTATAYGNVSAEQICYSNGSCFNIPVIADNWTETSGSMGSDMTHSLADVFTQAADRMEASGEADSIVLSMLRRMADSGHTIGFEQEALSEAIATACPTGDCFITLDAENTLFARNELLPDWYDGTGQPVAISTFRSQLGGLETMINSGNYIPPEMESLVFQEANQILTLAESTPWISLEGTSYRFTGTDNNNAPLTHQSANTICDAGDGGETCTVQE